MAAKEQPAARDQTAARTATDQAAKEQAAREQAAARAREQAAKEQAAARAREQTAKEQAAARAREQTAKEQAAARAREQAAKEQAPVEQVLQDQILSAVRTGQEATLHLAKTWVETFASVTQTPFDPRTVSNLNNYQGFTERLLSSNRDFVVSLFKLASEFGKKWPEPAKQVTRRG